MIQLNPYISFNGRCREAMTYYQALFGGELTLQTVAETPMAAQCPAGMQQQLMHSQLKNESFILMGTDMVPPQGQIVGNNIAIAASCGSEQEINTVFNTLAEGGIVADPLKLQFWGDYFGVVVDKYNICWMLTYTPDPQSIAVEASSGAALHD